MRSRRTRRVFLAVFLGSFCLLAIVNSGHYGWSDDKYTMEAMRNFLRTGNANVTPGYTSGLVGRGGMTFVRMEAGINLLGMPGMLAGLALNRISPMPTHLSPIYNSWAEVLAVFSMAGWTALLAAILALCLVELRCPPWFAVFSALAIVGGSTALDMSRYLNSSNGSMLALALAIYATIRAWRASLAAQLPSLRIQILFAAALILVINMRPTSFLLVPGLIFGWAGIVRKTWKCYLAALIGCGFGLLLKLVYNYHRSGSWLTMGYSGDYELGFFNRPILEGLFASLFVPRWSFLINCPISIPAFVCAFHCCANLRIARRVNIRGTVALWMALLILPQWAVYSIYNVPELYATRYHSEMVLMFGLCGSTYVYQLIRRGGVAGRIWAVLFPLLGVTGIVLHFAATLMPMPRFEGAYATTVALQGFSNYWRYMTVPPEAYEFYKQFASFPHPDWLVALLPGKLRSVPPLVCGIGALILIVAALTGLRQRASSVVFSGVALALLLVVVFSLCAEARKSLFTTTFDPTPSTPGRPNLERAEFYLLGSRIVADYHVRFPGSLDEKGKFRSLDGWITATSAAAEPKTIHVGGPNIFNSYLYGTPWEKMPNGSRMTFPNAGQQNPDVTGILEHGQEYDFVFYAAADKNKIMKREIGKIRIP